MNSSFCWTIWFFFFKFRLLWLSARLGSRCCDGSHPHVWVCWKKSLIENHNEDLFETQLNCWMFLDVFALLENTYYWNVYRFDGKSTNCSSSLIKGTPWICLSKFSGCERYYGMLISCKMWIYVESREKYFEGSSFFYFNIKVKSVLFIV